MNSLPFHRCLYFVLCISFAACSRSGVLRNAAPEGFSWCMFGRTADHGNYVETSVEPPLVLSWKEKLTASPVPSALYSGGAIFVAANDGQVRIFDEQSGKKYGGFKNRASQTAVPLIIGNSLILCFESGSSTVISHNLSSGKREWHRKLEAVAASPVYFRGRIYLCTLGGIVYSLNPSTGETVWKWQGKELFYASPAATDTLIVTAGIDGTVTGLHAETGVVLWASPAKRSFRSSPLIRGGSVFIGSLDGYLICFGTEDGTEKWKFKTGNKIYSTPASDGKTVVFGSNDGKIYALDQESGALRWSFQTGGLVVSAPLIAGGFVYCGSMDNTLYAFNKETGEKIWSFDLKGQPVQSPICTGSKIIISTNKKFTFAFSKK